MSYEDPADQLARVGNDPARGVTGDVQPPAVIVVQGVPARTPESGAKRFMFVAIGMCAVAFMIFALALAYWWWHWNSKVDDGVNRLGNATAAPRPAPRRARPSPTPAPAPKPVQPPAVIQPARTPSRKPERITKPTTPTDIAKPETVQVAKVVSGRVRLVDPDHVLLTVKNSFDRKIISVRVKVVNGLDDLAEVTFDSIEARGRGSAKGADQGSQPVLPGR